MRGPRPADAIRVELPYSEVCMHMRVAGKRMWVRPVGEHMAQLLNDDGSHFSIPVTRGEAGLPPLPARGRPGRQSGACSS